MLLGSNFRHVLVANLQIGVATVTCIAIWGGGLTVLLILAMNPESIPPASFTQGAAKADSVTV